MKQVFQSLDDGETTVLDVPAPQPGRGEVLVRTGATIVSAGTERMLVDFGSANYLQKARQQPDKVRQVLDKARTDGLAPTVHAVRSKLARPLPLGYANAGTVVAVGADVTDVTVGDLVATNGPHAEYVSVPRNLCALVPPRPDGTPLPVEQAAFATIGAIALQGVRLAAPTVGERVVVTGLGLIGLLSVQLLQAAGCDVLGLDPDPARVELARSFGARAAVVGAESDPVATALEHSHGLGIDAVLITASTKSSEPVHQAAQMCRQRGRIVLVGVTGLELSREDFYAKELTFQVSCSYGPGRYDPSYEDGGNDYPFGLVRWTAERNMRAFLELVARGRVDVDGLVTHRRPIDEAAAAYATLTSDRAVLALALTYPEVDEDGPAPAPRRTVAVAAGSTAPGRPAVAVIGAGNFTQQTLLPVLAEQDVTLHTIVSRGGATAATAARRFGFAAASTDVDAVLANDEVTAVVITTRHDTHAELAARALDADKDVYVEKPLAISHAGLDQVRSAYERALRRDPSRRLQVGFNRRHAPTTVAAGRLLATAAGPTAVVVTVNAGAIPADHWVHDPVAGGGRLLGEAVHFVDLVEHLVDSDCIGLEVTRMGTPTDDSAVLTSRFRDGSVGTVQYLAVGHPRFPKERVEAFRGGRVVRIDNFRRLEAFGWPTERRRPFAGQDKGHRAAVEAFLTDAPNDGWHDIAVSARMLSAVLGPEAG